MLYAEHKQSFCLRHISLLICFCHYWQSPRVTHMCISGDSNVFLPTKLPRLCLKIPTKALRYCTVSDFKIQLLYVCSEPFAKYASSISPVELFDALC